MCLIGEVALPHLNSASEIRTYPLQVPLRGQALVDFARKDRIFTLRRMTEHSDSSDKVLIAGAFELMLIYGAFVTERKSQGEEAPWAADINSDVSSNQFLPPS